MVVVCFVDNFNRFFRCVQTLLYAVVRPWNGCFLSMVRLVGSQKYGAKEQNSEVEIA